MFMIRSNVTSAVRAAVGSSGIHNKPLLTLTLVLSIVGVAQAQQATTEDRGEKAAGLDEITVTGSRIKRTTDFDLGTPTTVVDSNYLQNLGITNVGGALTQLPSNISTFSPATTGNSSFFAGSIIPNLRGLNPYFGSRTLALVDGQRFVPTNQGDGLDLNFIPSVLIDHMDVVTGGASAAYGSGAIAGVTNFIMNRKLEGGKFVADYGETQEQDYKDRHVGAAYGFSLVDGRAHLVLGAEWEKTGNAACLERSWCQNGTGYYPTATPNAYLLGSNMRLTQQSPTGVFYNGGAPATPTLQANAAGTGTVPFAVGTAGTPFSATPGGDGESIYGHTNLVAPTEREVFDALFTMALTDKVNMRFDGSWGEASTVNYTAPVASNFVGIAPDNAYLTPALAAANTGLFDKNWDDQVNSQTRVRTTVWRGVLGFDGKFGDSSWTWDTYAEYGHTYRTQLVQDNLHLNESNLALDSVLVNGVPECRSTATGVYPAGYTADPSLANGCVPLNPFGNQPLSAAAKAYAFGNLVEQLTYDQSVLAANTTGNLFDGVGLGAGPVSGAVGVEYRREKGNNIDNPGVPPAVASDYLIQYGSSFAGKVSIVEGYLETNVPILKDLPFARRMDVDLALRESRYDNTGLAGTDHTEAKNDITTWKINANWEPIDWLRFRGSYSADARAANFRELYYQQLIGAGGLFGFCGPNNTQPCNWNLEGNTALKPEKSKTTTLGFVLTPKDVLPGFNFAADYFRINIDDAIQQASVQGVLQGCQINHIQADCNLLVQAPGTTGYTDITSVTALASNGSGYVYKGVDITTSYHFDISSSQSLDFRLLATRMLLQAYQPIPGGPFVNVVGQVGTGNSFLADFQPTAHWTANFVSTFAQDPFSVTAQVRFVSEGIMNYNAVPAGVTPPSGGFSINDNTVPSYFLFNLNGAYKLPTIGGMNLTVFGQVNNLFDKVPPVAVGVGGFGANNDFGGTNAVFYDTFGRTFKIGVRGTF
jgi:iron complex outermembrane receptor protein